MKKYIEISDLAKMIDGRIKKLKNLLYEGEYESQAHIMGRLFELTLLLDWLAGKDVEE